MDVYRQFVNAALGQESQPQYYLAAEGRMLGDDEFVDELKHRVGDYVSRRVRRDGKADIDAIVKAAERATGFQRTESCSNRKSRQLVMVKEAIIVIGQDSGISARELAEVLGVDPSAVSKRREAARARSAGSAQMAKLLETIRSSAE